MTQTKPCLTGLTLDALRTFLWCAIILGKEGLAHSLRWEIYLRQHQQRQHD